MAREINLLLNAVEQGWAVVEKDTNVLWSHNDLAEADVLGRFDDEDCLRQPGEHEAVTGLFPGCMQQQGMAPDLSQFRPLAQTAHFLIFENE
jgi:hypothetical protein